MKLSKEDQTTWLHGSVFVWQLVTACCTVLTTVVVITFLISLSNRVTLHEQQAVFRNETIEALQKADQEQAEGLKTIHEQIELIIQTINAMRADQNELLQYGYFHKRSK